MHTKSCCKINFIAIYSDKRSVCIPILYTYIPRATVLRHGPGYVLVTYACIFAWGWRPDTQKNFSNFSH